MAVSGKGTSVSRKVAPRETAQTVVASLSPATRSHSPVKSGSQLACEKSPLTWMVAAQSVSAPIAAMPGSGSVVNL